MVPMMHTFLTNNRAELIARCTAKVALRQQRGATLEQLNNGIPLFLDQLTATLRAEEADEGAESLRISGPSGGDGLALSEMGLTASTHGKELLRLGFSVDQVVHNYGDLCQAITDLAFERDAPFAIKEFQTLNRCLDNAIADAVSEFSEQRDMDFAAKQAERVNERLGMLVHELRNALGTAALAVSALELGSLPMAGATGGVLKRSHASLRSLIDRALDEVRANAGKPLGQRIFSVASFIAEAKDAGDLDAASRGLTLSVGLVDPLLDIEGNRELLMAALSNLLHNAFKFTSPHSRVALRAYLQDSTILIEVEDRCGGLSRGAATSMFSPFSQGGEDKTGLGLGLSISRQSVEADGGTLTVRDLPGSGCTFTMALPAYPARPQQT
jgi:signal transduction histidine kinase